MWKDNLQNGRKTVNYTFNIESMSRLHKEPKNKEIRVKKSNKIKVGLNMEQKILKRRNMNE